MLRQTSPTDRPTSRETPMSHPKIQASRPRQLCLHRLSAPVCARYVGYGGAGDLFVWLLWGVLCALPLSPLSSCLYLSLYATFLHKHARFKANTQDNNMQSVDKKTKNIYQNIPTKNWLNICKNKTIINVIYRME